MKRIETEVGMFSVDEYTENYQRKAVVFAPCGRRCEGDYHSPHFYVSQCPDHPSEVIIKDLRAGKYLTAFSTRRKKEILF